MSDPALLDAMDEIGPVCPIKVYISLAVLFSLAAISGSSEGMLKTCTDRSTPPAASNMSEVTLFGDTQVQHVAPSKSGRFKVYRPDVELDDADARGRIRACER